MKACGALSPIQHNANVKWKKITEIGEKERFLNKSPVSKYRRQFSNLSGIPSYLMSLR